MSQLVSGGNVAPKQSTTGSATQPSLASSPLDIIQGLLYVLVAGVIVTALIIMFAGIFNATNRAQELATQRFDLKTSLRDTSVNINAALHNGKSLATIEKNPNLYLGTAAKDISVHLTPAVCKAAQSATTYSLVGLVPSQKHYMVYNSNTDRFVEGDYTNATLVPDLACQNSNEKSFADQLGLG